MVNERNRERILSDIAAIDCMERGKLCEMRRSSGKAYYSLQFWTGGKNRCEYVPGRDVEAVREAVANHARFRELVEEYAAVVEHRTRQSRRGCEGSEKGDSANRSPRRRPGR